MPRGAATGRTRMRFFSDMSRKREPSRTWRYQSWPEEDHEARRHQHGEGEDALAPPVAPPAPPPAVIVHVISLPVIPRRGDRKAACARAVSSANMATMQAAPSTPL